MMKILFTFVLLSAVIYAQSGDREDGNFWRNELTKSEKVAYLMAFRNGENHECDLILKLLPDKKPYKESRDKIIDFFVSDFKQSQHISKAQIIDGLDTLFSDFKNRRIRIYHAIDLIIKQINGITDEEYEKILEYYRKNDVD